MDDDELIEAAAADAATSVAALDLGPWVGLMLYPYGEELAAVAWGMPDLDAPLGINGDTMVELGMLESDAEAVSALRDRVASGEDWDLVERFYLALARRTHALIERPVLVYESSLMPEEEQLARHGGRGSTNTGSLAGLDVIVSVRVDEYRVAAVYRNAEGYVEACGSVGLSDEIQAVTRCAQLGADPVVLAGELPPGAVAPALDEGEPIVSAGYWICLTGRRTFRREPKVRFLDADGEVFDEVVPADGLPWLWPVEGPPGARVVQRGAGTQVLEAEQWRVETSDWGLFAPAAAQVAHELGVEETSVPARPIAGSVLGRRHGFELAVLDGVWTATATCGAFAATVDGRGEPPERLDLGRFQGSTQLG
jgi:hypothetical protein